jgi:hypothetical protein
MSAPQVGHFLLTPTGARARIRAVAAPARAKVGGPTAEFVDVKASLRRHLPLGLLIVGAITFVVLFLMTGSVVLPIKAVLMSALTLAAALGLLVAIFQDGRFEGVLDYTSSGALDASHGVVLIALALGLSTDYDVFLLARIKEARESGANEREAVAVGLERTGRIVTAAALLFCTAIGAFATSHVVLATGAGDRHRAGGDDRRHDRPCAAGPVADAAPRALELVGATAVARAARPPRHRRAEPCPRASGLAGGSRPGREVRVVTPAGVPPDPPSLHALEPRAAGGRRSRELAGGHA